MPQYKRTLKLTYSFAQKKRASTLLALAISEKEAAETLIEKELFRESLVHLYFTSFYATQAFLVGYLGSNPTHKNVEAQLHRHYGRKKGFPRRYIDLHAFLHELRNEYNYRRTYSPPPRVIRRKLGVLRAYVTFASRNIPKLGTTDLLRGIFEDNPGIVKDFSYDVYCPKTYRHHVRFTVWQPETYLEIFSVDRLSLRTRQLLKELDVHRSNDYVVGLNSKVNQYADDHLLMLDIDSVDVAVESVLSGIGGVLLKSGRGFHFIGRKVIRGHKAWQQLLRQLNRKSTLRPYLDQDHIDISLQRGYSTLRITASPTKPITPVFYKEL